MLAWIIVKTAPMKLFSLFPVLCLSAGVAAPGDGPPPEKTVSVSLLSAASETSWEPGMKKTGKKFQVALGFSIPAPGKIIGCRKEGIHLDMGDSTGAASAPSGYQDFLGSGDPELRMETARWTPSPEARWVSVKGNVPLIIAEKEAMSEGVLFTMEKNKEELPLVLKGGGLMDDGGKGDVKTALNLEWSLNKDSGNMELNVKLSSPRILGIGGVTLMKPDGTPVMGRNWCTSHSPGSGGRSSWVWEWDYRLDAGEQGKIQVFVNYMAGLRKLDVPVDMKFDLSGMVRETSREQR